MSMKTYALIGDVGGTNCRFRLISLQTTDTSEIKDTLVIESRYESSKFTCLKPAIQQFLNDNTLNPSSPQYPTVCVFCVAGPCDKISRVNAQGIVEEGTLSRSTALNWDMSSLEIADLLSIHPQGVRILNDFEGIGYGVLALKAEEFHTLTDSEKIRPSSTSPIAVIGPGTGLGVTYLTYQPQQKEYVVNSSEGGHTTYAAMDLLEFELVQYIQREFSTSHVSYERVSSGTGIRSVYRFLMHKEDPENPLYFPDSSYIYKPQHKPTKQQDEVLGAKHPAQIIFQRAQDGDAVCGQAVNIFLRALGNAAGNLGITTLPYGGIYIAGGMTPKIRWAFEDAVPQSKVDTNSFVESFLNKGRLAPYLEKVPVHLVLIDEVGLKGCSVLAKRMAFRTLQSKL